MSTKSKLKRGSLSPSNEGKKSPLSSKKRLIINLKDNNTNQIMNSSPSPKHESNSPKNKEGGSSPPKISPKNSEKQKKSILHTQRFDRSRTLKVVFRRPSEIINPQNLKNIINTQESQKSLIQRNFSIDVGIKDEKNPLKLLPKSLILYEEAKKLTKKVNNNI